MKTLAIEVERMRHQKQNKWHGENTVFEHVMDALTNQPVPSGLYPGEDAVSEFYGVDVPTARQMILSWVIYVHDIGKCDTAFWKDDDYGFQFLEHELIGAEIIHEIMMFWDVPMELKMATRLGVLEHMNVPEPDSSDRVIRRWLERVGFLEDFLLDIREADRAIRDVRIDGVEKTRLRIKEVKDKLLLEATKPKPVVTGNDVMEALGITPGPQVGRALAMVAHFTDKNEALDWLKNNF